jgi:hypothetical protein
MQILLAVAPPIARGQPAHAVGGGINGWVVAVIAIAAVMLVVGVVMSSVRDHQPRRPRSDRPLPSGRLIRH